MLFFCYSLFVHGKSSDEYVSIIMTVVLHPQRCRTSTSWWPRRPSHKRLVFAVVRAFFKRRLFVKSCSIASLEQVRTTSQCFWSTAIIFGFIVSSFGVLFMSWLSLRTSLRDFRIADTPFTQESSKSLAKLNQLIWFVVFARAALATIECYHLTI